MSIASLKFAQRQNQTLTPRLQQAVRLLQLSALDYEHELRELTCSNPFLEIVEPAVPDVAPSAGFGAASVAEPSLDSSGPSEGPEPAVAADAEGDANWGGDSWPQMPGSQRDGAQKPSLASAGDLMVADVDLRAQLRQQANLLPLSPRDHALVCMVIESVDDDGYLRIELSELARMAEFEPPADASELVTALRLVQSFEPAGVGARSVAECLALQLDKLDPAQRELGRVILRDHLERLARHDVAGMAAALGMDPAQVDAACAALRRLDPRPGWHHGASETRYVTPDVVVQKVRGKWVAKLNSTVRPRLKLSDCADMFQRHRESHHGALGVQLQEARWALRNIEQRFSTILDVAQAILRRQHLFFEHGPLAMKPLALRDIATELGIHESTVCRVTNNKFMATPAGLFELKFFFSRPMAMAGGGSCSATAIRGVLRELIDSEDPSDPLSDVAIAQRLAREGLNVARRTVTKYRQALKIAPAERRRANAAQGALLRAA